MNDNDNETIGRWRHFTTTTRILQGFAFLCKLVLAGITKFKYERKNVRDSKRVERPIGLGFRMI